ncbi:permease-like cell division protein FtsX [Sphaerisporangium fuscum]|uniref:permease-like cell division protein FtsX n=1 Tax=Sphaerisporangium fuscum TaxID=2835868 RepID=UPI001BDC6B1E|nr:permease-like cell division protein FtsX [Sphaerisporangium fuscum]
MRANFIFSEVWIGLRRNLTMTIAVIVTVAIGMALLGIGLLINAQVGHMSSYWSDKVQLSAFLCKKNDVFEACKGRGAVSQQEKDQLKSRIQGMPQVEQVTFEPQQEAYEKFKEAYSSNTVFLNAVKAEDMPESFRVKLKDPNDYKAVFDALKGAPGVSNVVNDQELLDKFFGFMNKLRLSALIVALIQVFAAILLIGNTVRLSAYNRRRETGIMRLVGASNLYIQLPFVMEGTIAGLIGGVISAVMLMVAKVVLFDSLQTNFVLATQLDWADVAQVITFTTVIGVVICILASFFTLRRYLRV